MAQTHVSTADAETVTVEQRKLSPGVHQYLKALTERFPNFTKDAIVDYRLVGDERENFLPPLAGHDAQARELWNHIDSAVQAIPRLETMPMILLRIFVSATRLAPTLLPEPNEPAVFAAFDGVEGVLRRYIVPAGEEAAPALEDVSIPKGLMALCQAVPPTAEIFKDNRPVGLDAANIYAPRLREKPKTANEEADEIYEEMEWQDIAPSVIILESQPLLLRPLPPEAEAVPEETLEEKPRAIIHNLRPAAAGLAMAAGLAAIESIKHEEQKARADKPPAPPMPTERIETPPRPLVWPHNGERRAEIPADERAKMIREREGISTEMAAFVREAVATENEITGAPQGPIVAQGPIAAQGPVRPIEPAIPPQEILFPGPAPSGVDVTVAQPLPVSQVPIEFAGAPMAGTLPAVEPAGAAAAGTLPTIEQPGAVTGLPEIATEAIAPSELEPLSLETAPAPAAEVETAPTINEQNLAVTEPQPAAPEENPEPQPLPQAEPTSAEEVENSIDQVKQQLDMPDSNSSGMEEIEMFDSRQPRAVYGTDARAANFRQGNAVARGYGNNAAYRVPPNAGGGAALVTRPYAASAARVPLSGFPLAAATARRMGVSAEAARRNAKTKPLPRGDAKPVKKAQAVKAEKLSVGAVLALQAKKLRAMEWKRLRNKIKTPKAGKRRKAKPEGTPQPDADPSGNLTPGK